MGTGALSPEVKEAGVWSLPLNAGVTHYPTSRLLHLPFHRLSLRKTAGEGQQQFTRPDQIDYSPASSGKIKNRGTVPPLPVTPAWLDAQVSEETALTVVHFGATVRN
jgi:hypothetical protein